MTKPQLRATWAIVALLALYGALVTYPAMAQTGQATLSWTPPTKNSDGTTLTDLRGFKVYWGSAVGSYPNVVTLSNAGLNSYVVSNLTPGTKYFVVTAFNAANAESVASNVASKLIAGASPSPPSIPQPVSLAGPVFSIATTEDSLVVLQSGTVVAGRPCDPTQQFSFGGVSYMRIDAALVTPLQGQQILAAWGRCQ